VLGTRSSLLRDAPKAESLVLRAGRSVSAVCCWAGGNSPGRTPSAGRSLILPSFSGKAQRQKPCSGKGGLSSQILALLPDPARVSGSGLRLFTACPDCWTNSAWKTKHHLNRRCVSFCQRASSASAWDGPGAPTTILGKQETGQS